MKEYQCHPFAKGIELISVGGTVFKHFALLGAKLKKRIVVITDNDNLNIEELEIKRNLPQEEAVKLFTEKSYHYIL
ncbi:TOPRIM nucleotidyl transferase/hydrolase domain-containing protein [Parabacteroides johnsonii]|uniref:TOPRIM nucleotidyl transferase/hydrolase domain-containing protein n=1 Tax=Parabacteroides johnsonii TaxID=387661 RepID=UPI001E5A9261|nr:TOPRIM nucleotidyl transferase/hydrolase domain-containing protein [Parabacteroides johnsonii]